MMKNDENGQLSRGIYSSPAAARSPLQGWVGDRSINIITSELPAPNNLRKNFFSNGLVLEALK